MPEEKSAPQNLALYRKWRPHQWEEVVGQPHVVQTLRNAVVQERVAHAYLFAGPRGTGKTTSARLLAKAVNCLEPDLTRRPCDSCEHCVAVNNGRFLDLIEIDAASNTSVEDVRSLRDKINFSPNQGRYKVYIVDEVHMLSTAAFNALLKTLEEPPPHAIFILATTEIHKIPATVLSRCQRHEFRRIPVNEIVALLKKLAAAEGLQVEDEALAAVARQATGAMRDAISLLDQLASSGEKITLRMAQDVLGTAANLAVIELVEALAAGDAAAGLDRIHQALDAGSDPRQFARQVVDYLRQMLLVHMNSASEVDATPEVRAQIARHAARFDTPSLLRITRLFTQAAADSRSAWLPSLPLEMAFVEALAPETTASAPAPALPAPRSAASPVTGASAKPSGRPAARTAPPPPDEPSDQVEVETGLTLKQVTDQWKTILARLHQANPNTAALLRSGRLLGIKNGTVYLGFSEVLKSKMEKNENLDLVRAAFQQVFQAEVPVQCIVYSGKSGALPPDIDSDGMVAAALRDLGGEIVDVQ